MCFGVDRSIDPPELDFDVVRRRGRVRFTREASQALPDGGDLGSYLVDVIWVAVRVFEVGGQVANGLVGFTTQALLGFIRRLS
ncbi:hypothetical protein BAY61_18220 [Prauserella marina]|nr:hypothetical protein BAY61_18220 [Prauserella marina]